MAFSHSLFSPRTAVMAVFTAFGAAVGVLAGAMAEVARSIAIGDQALGFAMTLSTLATVTAMTLGGRIAARASNRAVLLVALPLFALLLLAFLVAPSIPAFVVAFSALGFLFGLTDLFMNAEGAAIEHDLKRPVFTMFHACVSAATAVFAVVSSFASVTFGPWAAWLLPAAVFAVAWLLVLLHVKPRLLAPRRSSPGQQRPSRRPLVLLGLAAGLIIAAESAALLWSAKLLDGLAPQLAAIAGLGAAFFGLCNAVLRAVGDRLRGRFGDLPLMTWSLMAAIAGFAILGFSENFLLSVAAFAVVGLGTAVLIPCVFALAAAHAPERRAAALSFISLLSGAPRILAPWGIGWAASVIGTAGAFGLVSVGLAAALLMILVLRRSR